MYIAHFRVDNFRSFRTSGSINLTEGFNVIVGQNNSGKKSLIQALSGSNRQAPHRSLRTMPRRDVLRDSLSRITFTVTLGRDEFFDILQRDLPTFSVQIPRRSESREQLEIQCRQFQRVVHNNAEQSFQFDFVGGQMAMVRMLQYSIDADPVLVTPFAVNPDTCQVEPTEHVTTLTGRQNTLPFTIAKPILDRLYAFQAERMNIGSASVGPGEALAPNGSNLAQVLHSLMTRDSLGFQEYLQAVQRIFPDIAQITVPSVNSTQAEIRLWNVDPSTRRDDLAVSLTESGTGISQVLSILYVALVSPYPRVIMIDEPQSFLHPGAVRKLFDLLKHQEHQYIVATHSPTAIMATEPKTVLVVQKHEGESSIASIDIAEAEGLRLSLAEVGARLSDVFGADNILWVEGATEEQCFPLIVERLLHRPLFGTEILGVVNPGDLQAKDADRILGIYEKLSTNRALLPPAIGFILDRETRSEQQLNDLQKRGKNRVHFLPRRMYENYLLNPRAIASIIRKLDGFTDSQISADEINGWINERRWDRKYYPAANRQSDCTDEAWYRNVDGAVLLRDLFSSLSETRYEYQKVAHGEMLTRWLIDNEPEVLQEVADLLQTVLDT